MYSNSKFLLGNVQRTPSYHFLSLYRLSNLVSNTSHVCYVKLIVSGLDYSYRVPRQILGEFLSLSCLNC